ncbi:hypothetical protein B0H66DRAFT_534297 [Apodospora peruviana]|uniref:Uncharacterized protein n=1 Tax=Apodospora peruviana TaxID=516989 RepID=A0AAE0M1V6_9PEZI|nr:hypothetical protein B0H66DRAFT_534297 [Apodospora peruviana]
MTSDMDIENGCSFCTGFVTALKDVYTNTTREEIRPEMGKMHSFDWTFSDKIPSLPRLAASAKTGCRWGTPFDAEGPEAEERSATLTFRCAASSPSGLKSEGTLKDIRSLIAYMTAPSDGSFSARWGGAPVGGRIVVRHGPGPSAMSGSEQSDESAKTTCSQPGLPRRELHQETDVLSPNKCTNCGVLECGRPNSDTDETQFPSWSWLSSDWCDPGKKVVFGWSSILRIKDDDEQPRSKLITLDGEEGRLTVSGPVLPRDTVLDLVAHARDRSLTVDTRQPGTVFLDSGYEAGYVCSCEMQQQHTMPDCQSYEIIASLFPPLSALLIGRADFDMIPPPEAFEGSEGGSWKSFLAFPFLIQPLGEDTWRR